jgi:cell division protein FtsW (lipid II flippase)
VTAVSAASRRLSLGRDGRRWVELGLLVFAVILIAIAYLNVGYARSGTVPPDTLSYAASLGALFVVAHLALWVLAPYADPVLLPLVALLNGLGLVVIHRLDLAGTDQARQLGRATLPRSDAPLQLAWTAIGIGLFVATLLLVRDHRILQRFTYTSMAAGIVLLGIPAVLPARFSEVNGARIWIRVAGLSLQPGEVAKILLMVFFAGYFVAKRELLGLMSRRVLGLDIPRGRDLGPVVVAWLASLMVLVAERDLGTSLLFFGIFIAMLYVATRKVSWIALGVLLFAGGAYVAYHLFGHVRDRVEVWLHPYRHASTTGYQLLQGLFGLANGGVFGTGLGQGRPDIVPFAKSDFITTSIGEELGLAGLMAVLVIFLLISMRGLRAGLAVRDDFGRLLATGLAFGFALQVFVVVGGVTRLIPLTGLTLPFMAYGGSSLVTNWVLIALLLRISDASRRPPAGPGPLPSPATPGPPTLAGELQTEMLRGLGRP